MTRRAQNVDTTDHEIGQPGTIVLPGTGPAELQRPDIQIVDGPNWKEKADILAFMEEPVTVFVHTTNDKNAKMIVEVWNGGRVQRFLRGEHQTVKRKFVEVLARAKSDAFGNQEFVNPHGDLAYKYPKTTSLKYPFSVVRDDNPKGADWLKKILKEA
jgi:hypothetical protein